MIGDTIRAHAPGPIEDADRTATGIVAAIVLVAWLLAVLYGVG